MKKIMTATMIVLVFGFCGVSHSSWFYNCNHHAPDASWAIQCPEDASDYCAEEFPCDECTECNECVECPDVDCGDVTVEGGDLTSICRNYCAPDIDCGDVTVVGGDLTSICGNFCMQINVCDIECGDLDCSDLYCPEVTCPACVDGDVDVTTNCPEVICGDQVCVNICPEIPACPDCDVEVTNICPEPPACPETIATQLNMVGMYAGGGEVGLSVGFMTIEWNGDDGIAIQCVNYLGLGNVCQTFVLSKFEQTK